MQNGDFSATARQDIQVNRAIAANGNGSISLRADGGNLTIADRVHFINGDLSAFAGDDLTSTVGLASNGTGGISLTADAGDMRLGGPVTVINGDLTARAGGDMTAQQALASNGTGAIRVTAETGSLSFGGTVRVINNGFIATAGQDVTATGDIRVDGTGDIDVTAESGSIELDGPVRFINGTLTATADEDVRVDDSVTSTGTGSISVSAGGDFDLGGPVSFVNGYFTVDAGGDATISAPVTSTGTGTVEMQADRFLVESAIKAVQVTMEADTGFRLAAGGRVTGTGFGDSVVIAASERFANADGADAIRVTNSNARWLLYIDTFAGNQGVEPAPRAPDLYGRPYATTPPRRLAGFPGNRIVYGERPTLTLTGETLTKAYGERVASLSYTASGLRPGDTLGGALAGNPTVTSPGQPAGAPVSGSPYPTIVSAAASDRGYVLDLVDGSLFVEPAPLTIAANDASRTYGDPNQAFTATYTGFVAGDDRGDLAGTVTSPATPASDVGTYEIDPTGLRAGKSDADQQLPDPCTKSGSI